MVRRVSFAYRIELRDRARIAVLASAAFLLWVPFAGFPDLFAAFVTAPLSLASQDTLRLLGPAGMTVQDTYRQVLSIAVTLMCALWMTLWRTARSRGGTLGSAGWLGAGCVLAALALMDLPYRILHHNQAERAHYAGADCYVTGQSADGFLLFCPRREARVLSVSRDDPDLIRRGTFGSLFESIK